MSQMLGIHKCGLTLSQERGDNSLLHGMIGVNINDPGSICEIYSSCINACTFLRWQEGVSVFNNTYLI